MEDTSVDPYLGRVIAARYRLIRCVGRGGMGAVYECVHVQTEKRCAVKILAPRLSRDLKLIARFRREAMAASRLDHENCVAVYDFGEDDDGTFYIAMEYVDGIGLGQDIKRHGAMGADRAAHIGTQLLSALDAAHSTGILHRDLKPQNIMLTRVAGRDDVVKVVDFGIAKFIDNTPEDQAALTIPGTIFGTPEYMSPEQARGEALDARSDVYSASVVLLHALLGRSPFRGKTVRETLTNVFTDAPPSPRHERPNADIPEELERAIMGALVKEREQRTQDASTLLGQLQVFAKDLPGGLGRAPQFAPTPGVLPDGSAPETLADDEHSDPRLRRPRVPTERGVPVPQGPTTVTIEHRPDDDGPFLSETGDAVKSGDARRSANDNDEVFAPSGREKPSSSSSSVSSTSPNDGKTATLISIPDVRPLTSTGRNLAVGVGAAVGVAVAVAAITVWWFTRSPDIPVSPPSPVVVDLAADAPEGFIVDEVARDEALARARDLVSKSTTALDDERSSIENEALETFADAIRADPSSSQAHQGYATLLVKMRRWPEAKAHIERTVALDENARAHFAPILAFIEMQLAKESTP